MRKTDNLPWVFNNPSLVLGNNWKENVCWTLVSNFLIENSFFIEYILIIISPLPSLPKYSPLPTHPNPHPSCSLLLENNKNRQKLKHFYPLKPICLCIAPYLLRQEIWSTRVYITFPTNSISFFSVILDNDFSQSVFRLFPIPSQKAISWFRKWG